MTHTLHRKLAEWRDADSKARAAERTLTHLLFAPIEDPPRTDRLATEAKLLRQLADQKLQAAIAAMVPQQLQRDP